MQKQIDVIQSNWGDVCEAAELNPTEREFFWQRQFLNPFAFEDLEGALS
jgi:serine/threonine-protein kinase HipA